MKTKAFIIGLLACGSLAWLSDTRVFAQVGPTIVAHPRGLIVTPGSTVSFTVEATGDPPLRYRWRRGGVTLPGQTNATLVVTNATNSAVYSVIITNLYGTAASLRVPLSFFSVGRATNGIALDINGVFAQYPPLIYQIQYAISLPVTNWVALTNLELPSTLYRYVDTTVTNAPQRVYRAISLPWW